MAGRTLPALEAAIMTTALAAFTTRAQVASAVQAAAVARVPATAAAAAATVLGNDFII